MRSMAADVEPIHQLSDLRPLMSVVGSGTYLDHAAAGPIPAPVADAMRTRIRSACDSGVRDWHFWQKQVQHARRLTADLVGAHANEIAFVPNTATGIGLIAEGYPWKSGDNVVLSRKEFPSNRFPWMHLRRRAVDVRLVDTPDSSNEFADAIAAACDAQTRIVACSWVDYITGIRRDPEQLSVIAHHRGALLVLDAIQGLGVLPMDMQTQGVDVLVADSRKWMLGPEGAGILAVRQKHLDRFDLTHVGWASMVRPLDFSADAIEFSETASRFESGMHNTFGISGLCAVLQLLRNISSAERERQLLEIRRLFADAGRQAGLSTKTLPARAQSGIISFTAGETAAASLVRCLNHKQITVNLRHGRVRVSPHLYNTAEDAEHFAAAVTDSGLIT